MADRAPRVSVIIATRDRPAYLAEAIRSVLDGAFGDFEIIVTDDAGVSENRDVAASFDDPRIKYRRNDVPLQSAHNHRAAIRLARGEYVAMLNDDDQWEPDFLATLVPIMDRHPVVLAFADHHVMDAAGMIDDAASRASSRRWKRDQLAAGIHQPFHKLALVDQSIATVAALIRRSALDWENCPAEVGSLYDLWITYQLCRDGRPAYYVPRRLARYRAHAASSSANGGALTTAATVFVYSVMYEDRELGPLRRLLWKRLAVAKLTHALALLEQGEARAARGFLRDALAPRQLARARFALVLTYLPAGRGAAVLRAWRAARRPRAPMLPG